MRRFAVEYGSKILCGACGREVKIRANSGCGWTYCVACDCEGIKRPIKTLYCDKCRKETPHGECESSKIKRYWCLKCGIVTRKSDRKV